MSALEKLQKKIQQWKREHEALITLNESLKSQLADVAAAQEENEAYKIELEASRKRCTILEEEIASLRRELEEKDAEIEKIIAQVETLLA